MNVHPHIMHAVARERTADLLRAAAAHRAAAQAAQNRPDRQPAPRPLPAVSPRQDLIPAGTEQR